MNTNEAIRSLIATQDDKTLIGSLAILEAKTNLDDAEKMVRCFTIDALTVRHDVEDAADDIYMSDSFEGTQTDALLAALAAKGVAA